MKPLLFLAALLSPLAALAANPARLIAYTVRPEMIEAAREMTADDCRQKLTALWTENVDLTPNTPLKVAHTAGGRSVLLQMEATAMPGTPALRINYQWAEKVKPATGPEVQRGLNSTVLVNPGTAVVVARNFTQVSGAGERPELSNTGLVYVLAVWADDAAK